MPLIGTVYPIMIINIFLNLIFINNHNTKIKMSLFNIP